MSTKKDKDKGAKTTPPKPGGKSDLSAWKMFVFVFGNAVDKLGMPAAIFTMCLFAVWLLGSEKTHDDFIREVLFADVTHTRYVQLFFGGLVLLSVGGILVNRRSKRTESKEMKRLADEKSRLQEKLAGTTLSHTDDGDRKEPREAVEGGN